MRHVATPQTRCLAGIARCDITPPVGIYHRMWGAAVHDRATGVHRPLLATALWLQPLRAAPMAAQMVIALDACVMDSDELLRLRAAIGTAIGLPSEQVQITLSHTHGSGWMTRTRAHFPGGELIGPYLDELSSKLVALARQAQQTAQPATVSYGQGRCSLAAQRDFWDEVSRQYVCGFNPDGSADDTVLVARITGESGPLGTIVNYACHPTTLAWDNTAISPDYVGAMREVVEQATGAPCLFLQGASGDLGPREGFVGDWQVADRNGRQLGYAALAALAAIPPAGKRYVYTGPVVSGAIIGTWKHEPLDAEPLARQEAWQVKAWTVALPYRHDLPTLAETQAAHQHWQTQEQLAQSAGEAAKARECRALVEQMHRRIHRINSLPAGRVFPYRVQLCRFGDALWVLAPGELYQTFQVTLRARCPQRPIVIATLTNDWQPGYLPAASSYGYGIYQESIAVVGPGALEVLIEAVTRELN